MLQKVECKGIMLYDSFRILKHLDILKTIVPNLDEFLPGEIKSSKLPFLKHVIVINNPWDKQKKAYKGTWDYIKIAETNLSNKSYEKPYVEQVYRNTVLSLKIRIFRINFYRCFFII